MLGRLFGNTGRAVLGLVHEVGLLTLTGLEGSRKLVRSFLPGERFRGRSALQQLLLMGTQAVPIVLLICFMMGAILALQSAYSLRRFGAELYVADLVAVALTRELGPVITAIVVAGRSGSAIAAELGTMKIQEELDALSVMGLNPFAYLVAPKFLAMLIAVPLLTALGDVVGIFGGFVCGTVMLDLSAHQYVERTQEALAQRDFLTGLVKAAVFAMTIASVGTYCGLGVQRGAQGVGLATTRSVVLSIFLVIVADLVFTGIFFRFG